MSMGLFEYTFRIVISSIIYNDYNAPWELFADLIGGVQEKKNSANNNFILIFLVARDKFFIFLRFFTLTWRVIKWSI